MQYVSVENFRAHLLKGADCISVKQTLLYQRRLILERNLFFISQIKSLSNSKLAFKFFFFKDSSCLLFWW